MLPLITLPPGAGMPMPILDADNDISSSGGGRATALVFIDAIWVVGGVGKLLPDVWGSGEWG